MSTITLRLHEVPQELLDRGFTVIPFPVERRVKPVVNGWLRFLEQPQEDKDRFSVGNADDPDDGYILRTGESRHCNAGGNYDEKEFFHYTTALPELLERAEVHYTRGAFGVWISRDLRCLYNTCLTQARTLTSMLCPLFPDIPLMRLFDEATQLHKHTIRLLCYREAQVEGKPVGKFHDDRDFLTWHLDESHRGLVCVKNGERFMYDKRRHTALVFPGLKMAKVSSGRIPALEHGVIATPETVGKRRWSAVFFSHINLSL